MNDHGEALNLLEGHSSDYESPIYYSNTEEELIDPTDSAPYVSKFEQEGEVSLIAEPRHWTYKEQIKILILAIIGGFIGPFTNPLFLPVARVLSANSVSTWLSLSNDFM